MQSLWLRVSNRGEQHPVGTRFCAAKSSVLYLLRPLTQERGCHRTGQTVSCGSRRTNICKHGRLADIRSSGVGDAAKCRAVDRNCVASPGEQKVYKTRRSDASPKIVAYSSVISSIIFKNAPHASMMDANKNVRRCSYHHGSSNHTLSRACASVFFALLSDR